MKGQDPKVPKVTTPGTIESSAELHVNSVTKQTSVVPEEIDSRHNGPRPKLRLNQFSPTNAMSPFAEGLRIQTKRTTSTTNHFYHADPRARRGLSARSSSMSLRQCVRTTAAAEPFSDLHHRVTRKTRPWAAPA